MKVKTILVSLWISALSAVWGGPMVWIPPGTFTMGSASTEPGFNPAHGPKHQVTISRGFWMSRYEVTQGEYAQAIGTNPSRFTGNTNRPVERVSWFDATRYCELLTSRERAAGRLSAGDAYRLPTEAEWEYACRAGTTNIWSWGNDASAATNYAWLSANSGGTTHPVGQKQPNPWGLYDMHGNVSEWVWDFPATYTTLAQTDPIGTAVGTLKPLRGGFFAEDAGMVRSGRRWLDQSTNNTWHGWGFRVVLAASTPAYFTDFEAQPGPEWSSQKVSSTPAGARKFLGEFGNETVTLSLSNLSEHAVVRVSFDLFVIRTWDGSSASPNPGPDIWSLSVRGGPSLLRTTFNNYYPNFGIFGQAYPGEYPGTAFPPFFGASEVNTLGFTYSTLGDFNSVYHIVQEFEHASPELGLQFSASGLQALADESWGVDNVQVMLFGDPSPPEIEIQPRSQTVAATYPASFFAAVSGTAPLRFQWHAHGTDIPSATNTGLRISSVTLNHAGAYGVSVSNRWGSAVSSNAILSVRAPLVVTTPPGQAGSLGMAIDAAGNIYVADQGNHRISKITPAGTVSTLAGRSGQAGSADGTGINALFNGPTDVALGGAGDLFVADSGNQTIRKISPSGVVTTLAGLAGAAGSTDGTGATARFRNPIGIAIDRNNNLYVGDEGNRTVRKITPTGVVSTFAGLAGSAGSADGIRTQARFNSPRGMAVDSDGTVYVADWPSTIRRITPGGAVTTLAGVAGVTGDKDGEGNQARFNGIVSVAFAAPGNFYVADPGNQLIRHMTRSGLVTTVAGLSQTAGSVNGMGSAARLNDPRRIAADQAGNVYVSGANQAIRKGSPAWGDIPPALSAALVSERIVINVNVPVGFRVVVEASENLQQWEILSDAAATEAVLRIAPAPRQGPGTRFYRAKYFLP